MIREYHQIKANVSVLVIIYQTHMLFIVMNIGLTQPTSIHYMDRRQ